VDPAPRIRRATAADLPTIVRHRMGMFTEMGIGDPAQFSAYVTEFEQFAARAMAAGSFLAWLAETDSGGIGAGGAVFIVPWPANPKARKQERAFLLNVYTEPEHRRRGYARLIVRTMLDWCRSQGFSSVFLHASDAGRPLYLSLGFTSTSELRFDFA
jgi:GNAT superfamily N-acetyltransferase